jgi:hypothetical protein
MKYLVFIDVAGYTKSMVEDQKATKKLIETYEYLIKGKIGTLSGEIIQSAGDGFYIQFDSTIKATKVINCLVSIIESVSELRNFLAIRMGVHFADLEKDTENDININIAQRLETAAYPNQINISEIVYDFIKNDEIKYEIKKDKRDLKGLGAVNFFRINILKSDENIKYKTPRIKSDYPKSIEITNDSYTARILLKDDKKSMIETKYNDGDSVYTEMNDDGSVNIKLNNKETYTYVLFPDEDLLEKNEKIEDNKIIVSLRYKWDALINIVYNSDHKIISVNSQNTTLNISNKEKTVSFEYNFGENPIKINKRNL